MKKISQARLEPKLPSLINCFENFVNVKTNQLRGSLVIFDRFG